MIMGKKSAGILAYKYINNVVNVFLVHPGGPFWKAKDWGTWSIPKGEFNEDEKALDAAIREFNEETGIHISGEFIELTPVKLKSGKTVYAWALQSDIEISAVNCESFIKIEWPPKSGKFQSFPEIDKGEWFTIDKAKQKINPSQTELIDELIERLST